MKLMYTHEIVKSFDIAVGMELQVRFMLENGFVRFDYVDVVGFCKPSEDRAIIHATYGGHTVYQIVIETDKDGVETRTIRPFNDIEGGDKSYPLSTLAVMTCGGLVNIEFGFSFEQKVKTTQPVVVGSKISTLPSKPMTVRYIDDECRWVVASDDKGGRPAVYETQYLVTHHPEKFSMEAE